MPQGQVRRPAQGCLAGKRRDLRPGGFSDADLDSEQDLLSGADSHFWAYVLEL